MAMDAGQRPKVARECLWSQVARPLDYSCREGYGAGQGGVMEVRIMGSACPERGGCDYYCADCYDEQLAELEAVADAAQAVVADALDALDDE